MMGRAWVTRAVVVAGAASVAGLISPTGVASAGTASAGAAATAGQGFATAAQRSTEHASTSRSDAHRCRLPVFGPGRSYHPRIDRKSFTTKVTNPWFPLVVGRTMVYTGTKDGKRALDIVVVTRHVKRIDGVSTRVLEDRLYLNGVLEERTRDYYSQDRCGNVWYFGEDTATLDAKGKVTSTEGSFHAGVQGAEPGVFMQAAPQIGRWFRQEWYAGQAEDRFKVLQRRARVTVPYGSFSNALRAEERTHLEPDVVDNKYYVRGVGEVFEGAVKGPQETLRLVEIIS